MNNNILTEDSCNKLSERTSWMYISPIPLMSNNIAQLRSILNHADIKAYIEGTANGTEFYNKLSRNLNSLDQLVKQIESLAKATDQLITASRNANKATGTTN